MILRSLITKDWFPLLKEMFYLRGFQKLTLYLSFHVLPKMKEVHIKVLTCTWIVMYVLSVQSIC